MLLNFLLKLFPCAFSEMLLIFSLKVHTPSVDWLGCFNVIVISYSLYIPHFKFFTSWSSFSSCAYHAGLKVLHLLYLCLARIYLIFPLAFIPSAWAIQNRFPTVILIWEGALQRSVSTNKSLYPAFLFKLLIFYSNSKEISNLGDLPIN